MTTCYVGIGSNVGDRIDFVRRAVALLAEVDAVEVVATSSLYETSPLGGPPQRSFINMVAEIDTELDPHGVLAAAKAVEQTLGRTDEGIRWGPRVADLDVLLYGDVKINDPDLEIPHPRLTQRRFALIPLLEVAPEATDPWGRRYSDFLHEAEGSVELAEAF